MYHIILAWKSNICHAQSIYSVICTGISSVKFTFNRPCWHSKFSTQFMKNVLFKGEKINYEIYRGADKSLARPGRKQATATEDFDFNISYL